MEVTNTFKGLNLVERLPKELWTEVYNVYTEKAERWELWMFLPSPEDSMQACKIAYGE